MMTLPTIWTHTIRFKHVGISHKVCKHVAVTLNSSIDAKAEMAKWCGGRVEIVSVATREGR
jgi:hypothetical protein